MFDIMPADIESSDEKPSLSRRLINKTLQHAQDAVEFASDTSRNIAGVADAALLKSIIFLIEFVSLVNYCLFL